MHLLSRIIVLILVLVSTSLPTQARAARGDVEAAALAASAEFKVPAPVLLALSYVLSRWDHHDGKPSFDNGYGLMNLQDNSAQDQLPRAAALLGRPKIELIARVDQNVRGAAALLREAYAASYPDDAQLLAAADLNRWYQPVVLFLATDKPAAMRNFGDAVFGALAAGARRTIGGQDIVLPKQGPLSPHRGTLESIPNDRMRADVYRAGRGYRAGPPVKFVSASRSAYHVQGGADSWLTANDYSSGRYRAVYPYDAVSAIGVVIHTCQSNSSTCQNELVSAAPPSKSAHYLVYSLNGHREQLVHREDTAFHCGECPSASFGNWNPVSIGIEHEGKTWEAGWYTSRMYAASAWLTAYACADFWFGCDRNHVVGHEEIQQGLPDPGPYWDWGWYMYCVGLRYDYIRWGIEFYDCW